MSTTDATCDVGVAVTLPTALLSRQIADAKSLKRTLRDLKRETQAVLVHQRTLLTAKMPVDISKIHVGAGSNIKPGWVNVDLYKNSDLRLDIRQPLPFPDGSVELIFGEHVFEHLRHPAETAPFLAECLRVLRSRGMLKLAVPDARVVLEAYVHGDGEIFEEARRRGWHPSNLATWMDQINWVFRQGGEHHWAWDAEALIGVLSNAGFVDAREREFELGLDDEGRRLGGLLVEGRRP